MPLFRRFGRPGLLGLAARTAVVAGTATAVTGAMRNNQQRKAQESVELADYEAEQQQTAYRQATAPTAPTTSGTDTIAELERLAALHAQGALTDDEFSRAKANLLT